LANWSSEGADAAVERAEWRARKDYRLGLAAAKSVIPVIPVRAS
jgi:hypothetical protein